MTPRSGSVAGGQLSLAPDQVEVAAVHEQAGALSDDEDRVQAEDGVDQQREPAADREVPEVDRDHALLLPLRRDPLDQKARGEQRLPEEAEDHQHPADRLTTRIAHQRTPRKVGMKNSCRRTFTILQNSDFLQADSSFPEAA